MRPVSSSPSDPFDFRGVQRAYHRVAEDYATRLPDTRAEDPLDLAMVDAFAEAVTSGDDARVLDAGCGAGRMSRYLAERGCLVAGDRTRSQGLIICHGPGGGAVRLDGSLSDAVDNAVWQTRRVWMRG
jgi:SAM-dependent methyltransferase